MINKIILKANQQHASFLGDEYQAQPEYQTQADDCKPSRHI
jgi:hypothetical protein